MNSIINYKRYYKVNATIILVLSLLVLLPFLLINEGSSLLMFWKIVWIFMYILSLILFVPIKSIELLHERVKFTSYLSFSFYTDSLLLISNKDLLYLNQLFFLTKKSIDEFDEIIVNLRNKGFLMEKENDKTVTLKRNNFILLQIIPFIFCYISYFIIEIFQFKVNETGLLIFNMTLLLLLVIYDIMFFTRKLKL